MKTRDKSLCNALSYSCAHQSHTIPSCFPLTHTWNHRITRLEDTFKIGSIPYPKTSMKPWHQVPHPDRQCQFPNISFWRWKVVVFFGAPDPSLLFILENLQKFPFLPLRRQMNDRIIFSRNTESCGASACFCLSHSTISYYTSFFHLSCIHPYGQQHSSQVCGCWWTALKIPFADSMENVSVEFNFRRKICSCIIKCYFWPLKSGLYPQCCAAHTVTHL